MNVSEALTGATIHLDQHVAEVAAVVRALTLVKELKKQLSGLSVVIIKTDSCKIVTAASGENDRWSDQEFEAVRGWPKLKTRLRATIEGAVTDLEESTGLRVKFWWAPREYNSMANTLVGLAMVWSPLSEVPH